MLNLAFYNNPTALIILAVVVLVLFGSQKIPELMRGIGQGAKEFKKGMNDDTDDELQKDKERERLKAELRAEIDREKNDKDKK